MLQGVGGGGGGGKNFQAFRFGKSTRMTELCFAARSGLLAKCAASMTLAPYQGT